MPRLQPGRLGLIAYWDDEPSLDRFLARHPLAARMDGGWHVRLQPLQMVGQWPTIPAIDSPDTTLANDGPVAALTLGSCV